MLDKRTIYSMEPMLPSKTSQKLENLSFDLISKSKIFNNGLHPLCIEAIGDLIRSMNCYYSNLIEGHNTHPIDIEKALHGDYSQNIQKRNLQLEALAHIQVQKKIDQNELEEQDIISFTYISSLHKQFYELLPEELKWINNEESKKNIKVKAGELRKHDVKIGFHVAPSPNKLPLFISRFEEAYNLKVLSRLQQLIALGASHHRLLWIHPFSDGNGRVTRLFTHAFLKRLGIGNSLWSISRGLARRHSDYKKLLMQSDHQRLHDSDGRGHLSETALVEFCEFMLEVCLDQIDFMAELLSLNKLLERVSDHIHLGIQKNELPKGSYSLIREALISGSFERGDAAKITGYKERQARTVLSTLLNKGLLYSEHSRAKVKINFPVSVLDKWFPGLY